MQAHDGFITRARHGFERGFAVPDKAGIYYTCMIGAKTFHRYKSFMQPPQKKGYHNLSIEEKIFASPEAPQTLITRDEARRYLVKLLTERQFQLAIFVGRKLFFNSVILIDDLNFLMTSIRLALENGHSDVITN
jgi:hypothetical protein